MAGGQANAEAALRYASALFDLARDAGAIDVAAEDAAALKALLAGSEDLRGLIANPAFSREDKQAALLAVAERAGLRDLTRRFLGVVASNGRSHDIPGIIAALEDKIAAHRGVAVAEVASPTPLSEAQLDELRQALKRAHGQEVELRHEVRPDLLGGLVVKIGSKMFDSSLKTKLEGLKSAMKGA